MSLKEIRRTFCRTTRKIKSSNWGKKLAMHGAMGLLMASLINCSYKLLFKKIIEVSCRNCFELNLLHQNNSVYLLSKTYANKTLINKLTLICK